MLYRISICIAYILGELWGLNLSDLSLAPIFLIIIICMLLVLTKQFNKKIIVLVAVIIFGVTNTYIKYLNYSNKYNESIIEDYGKVIRLISRGEYYDKYLLKLNNGDKMLFYYHSNDVIPNNSIISFKGNFEVPTTKRNKGGFDYSKYLYSQDIYGSIYIKNNNVEIIDIESDLINNIRESIINTYKKLLPNKQFSILLGMIIGDTYYLDDDIKESFKISGITHLLAVSR